MSDIVEMLKKTVNLDFGTYDVADDSVRIGCGTLKEAISEIEGLRAKLNAMYEATRMSVEGGLIVPGQSFADIKKEIRDVK